MISHSFPIRQIKGIASSWIAYPIAEHLEKRDIGSKLRELRRHYKIDFKARREIARKRLVETLEFCDAQVPYYTDLFRSIGFTPSKLEKDSNYLLDLPLLTKEIIREQGDRLLSAKLGDIRHHERKTGGSTGLSCVIFYDQPSLDYSAAVTLYTRERVGKKKSHPELHFACRFPDAPPEKRFDRESMKCFAMNRSNIFFDRLDHEGLEEIWQTLRDRKPMLAHAHPSTMYALACYIGEKYGGGRAFDVFESSGELLEPHMRKAIEKNLRCRVVDRYGLAEFGVMAYEFGSNRQAPLQFLDSEGWPESRESDHGMHELVISGFRNRLMPLIRYATGDQARVVETEEGFFLTDIIGRIHDIVPIGGVSYPTHHIQDILDHRVGGIQEFQIDLRTSPSTLRIVPEPHADIEEIKRKIHAFWGDALTLLFVNHNQMIRVGGRSKFRHVVTA